MLAVGALGGLGRLGLVAAAVRQLFDPRREFFSNGEQGVWYDPSDLSTLFQDSAGTTPVTAVEQPVGLMLDKRLGLVLGSELGVSGSVTGVPIGGPSFTNYTISASVPSSAWVLVAFTVSNYLGTGTVGVAGAARWEFSPPSGPEGNGVYKALLRTSVGGAGVVQVFTRSTNTCTFSNISVRELPGNHAFQTTAIDRPILRNRYNLLTNTAGGLAAGSSGWTSQNASGTLQPDGSSLIARTSTSLGCYASTPVAGMTIGARICAQISAKKGSVGNLYALRFQSTYPDRADVVVNLDTGAVVYSGGTSFTGISASVSGPDPDGFHTLVLTATVGGTNLTQVIHGPANNASGAWEGASGVLNAAFARRPSLVPADQASLPYQRVNTATDYDSDPSKFPLYLQANGTNTWMQTNSIDFSSTDKVTVFAGVRKLSDAATGVVAELGTDSFSINGSFGLFAPAGGGSFSYRVQARGTNTAAAGGSAFAPSPDTSVISAYAGIAAALTTLRRNGSSVGSTVSSLGTGNYGNYPLYLFRRGGTSLPANIQFHGLLIRGALTNDAQIASMERWLAPKTGVTL